MPCSFRRLAQNHLRGDVGKSERPSTLERNGTVRDERGLTSMTYTFSLLVDDELDVVKTDDADAAAPVVIV